MESSQRPNETGQSLVEVAILTPLLIFMMIGVFEVGYVLRDYLILINLSRETARYTARPNYINFPPTEEELENITLDVSTKSSQVMPNFVEDGQVSLTHVKIDLGRPCIDNDYVYTTTSQIIFDKGFATQISGDEMAEYLILKEEEQFCQNFCMGCNEESDLQMCLATGELWQCPAPQYLIFNTHEFVVVEVFYTHYQLFGFPFISNPFSDPILLNAQTTMRYGTGMRGDAGIYFED